MPIGAVTIFTAAVEAANAAVPDPNADLWSAEEWTETFLLHAGR